MTANPNQINIAFFGTSDKSEPILNALKNNLTGNVKLVLCITKTDTKVGRKHELKQTGVKKWAINNGIKHIEIDNLKNDNLALVLSELKNEHIELGIIADFSIIIPTSITSIYSNKLINIHFSLLPKYRGASPVQHTILNGDKITGITYFLIDSGMDTGDILAQVSHKLDGTETTGSLQHTLFELAAEKLPQVIAEYMSGIIKPTPQQHENATYCYSPSHPKSTYIYKEDALINWSDNPEQIVRKVRAYNPWPIAWTTLDDMRTASAQKQLNMKIISDKHGRVKIYAAKLEEDSLENNTANTAGKVPQKLIINKLQVEGKKVIEWSDFVHGYCLAPSS